MCNTAAHPCFFYELIFCLGAHRLQDCPLFKNFHNSNILLILYCDGEKLKADFAFKNVSF